MFDEVSLRLSLGCRLLPGQLAVGQFGPGSASYLVGISQTLDKLLVHPLPANPSEPPEGEPFYISPRDVIKSLAVKKCRSLEPEVGVDLLVIGCASSVLIYDVCQRTNLASVATPTAVSAIACELAPTANRLPGSAGAGFSAGLEELFVCAGPQKLYTLKLESSATLRPGDLPPKTTTDFELELASERSVGDSVACLATGSLAQLDFVLTGSSSEFNNAIRLHQLDAFEQNLSPARLSIEEASRVSCLCAIETAADPEVAAVAQTNYFAFALENGFIGVYRLISSATTASLAEERLWRHRSKQPALAMLMFDADGNGLDELLVAYANGRLEARAPFTGQLLAATRLFKADSLAGLALAADLLGRPSLLACSTSGQLVGFKRKLSKPRALLQGYNLSAGGALHAIGEEFPEASSRSDAGFNQKVISEPAEQEQEQKSIFGTGKQADLHIELPAGDTKPTNCEARQNGPLLERINLLQCEQLELSNRLRHIYNRTLGQASRFFPSDLSLLHRWDFDELTLSLRLSVFVATGAELVKLIKLEDESRNMIPRGHLFARPRQEPAQGDNRKQQPVASSRLLVARLRCARNKAARLELRLFCESQHQLPISKQPAGGQQANREFKLCRVYNKTIEVPKFAMFTFAKISNATPNNNNNRISLKLQLRERGEALQVLNWLEENFLCFRFTELAEDRLHLRRSDNPNRSSSLLSDEIKLARAAFQMNHHTDLGDFEFKFADMNSAEAIATQTAPEQRMDSTNQDKTSSEDEPKLTASGPSLAAESQLEASLRVAVASGALELEAASADLVVDLVQSLVIDRLRLEPAGRLEANVGPLLEQLESVSRSCSQLEESERRVQSELYESADYSKSLLQQLAISKELNEFSTSKNLLTELGMMLNGTQNAALVHSLNSRSRGQLSRQISELKGKIGFLSGRPL